MGLLGALRRQPTPAPKVERRIAYRCATSRAASFQTMSGVRDGMIVNISEGGARIEMPGGLPIGISGMLTWDDQEVFCTVAWSNDEGFGLEFDRPVAPRVVDAMSTGRIEASGPVADVTRIPMGRKRARIGSA
ncbi:PilZ domain-containing protein [Altererythrobacter sp. CAU 1778]